MEASSQENSWVQPTLIDDDDLTFGGKPLSAWYEEERRRLSTGHGEEDSEEGEARGRRRERRESKQ